jgi:hypothetical protein
MRRVWNPKGNASSHKGLAAILAGGGWTAFFLYALPFKSIGGGRLSADSWEKSISVYGPFDAPNWLRAGASTGTNPVTPGYGW